MKIKLLIFGMLFAGLTSQAAQSWHTAKIKTIYPLADGSVVVTFFNDSAECRNNGVPNKYYFLTVGVNGVSDLGFKNMYSVLLTAGASGKDLTINFEANSTNCDINRLLVNF